MDNTIIFSVLTMLGLGAGFAIFLSLAYKFFKVEEDPKVKKIEEKLPGLNCGACGFGSCHSYAQRLVQESDTDFSCPSVSGSNFNKIMEILGLEPGHKLPVKAIVHCGGERNKIKVLAKYEGVKSCQAAQLIKGGFLECDYGCLGLGDCAEVCPVDAIEVINGLAKVDINKCVGCGKCVEVCPRDIITLEKFPREADSIIKVNCNSKDFTKQVREACKVGCIACKLCEKKGPDEVFKVQENLSYVDYKNAKEFVEWEEVINICPTDCIKVEEKKIKV